MHVFRPTVWTGDSDGPPGGRRVLILCSGVPQPYAEAGPQRAFHLIQQLGRCFDVAVACTAQQPIYSPQRAVLEESTGGQVLIHRNRRPASFLRGAAAMLTGQAATAAAQFRPRFARQIVLWHNRSPFDTVITVGTEMLQYTRLLTHPRYRQPELKHPPARVVFDLIDLHSIRWTLRACAASPPLRWFFGKEAKRLREIEAGRDDLFTAVTFFSPTVLASYGEVGGYHLERMVVTNGVDLDAFEPQQNGDDRTILFVGDLHHKVNVAGVLWFANRVLPLLRQRVPRARLKLVGARPASAIRALSSRRDVRLVEPYPDVRAHLHPAALLIAPQADALGAQQRVLEAMACGKAVVCTPQIAHGLGAEDGDQLLVSRFDDPGRFARQVYRVLKRPIYRQYIGDCARLWAEQSFAWDQVVRPLVDAIGSSPATAVSRVA